MSPNESSNLEKTVKGSDFLDGLDVFGVGLGLFYTGLILNYAPICYVRLNEWFILINVYIVFDIFGIVSTRRFWDYRIRNRERIWIYRVDIYVILYRLVGT